MKKKDKINVYQKKIIEKLSFNNRGVLPNDLGNVKDENLKIIEKKKENSICKIIYDDEIKGNGFLSLVPFPDKVNQSPVLITCNHVLKGDEKEVKLILNNKVQKILILDNTRKMYINNEIDIIIIEIKKEDNLDYNNILEVDDDIFEINDLNEMLKSIYIINYPFGKESSFSINRIENIKDEIIEYKCSIQSGSSCELIINVNSFKVIGIHKGTDKQLCLNTGILLKEIIKNFVKINNKNDKKEGKRIYYYDNGDRYEGDFKNDKKEGKGIYYYNNGDKYEGAFKNDKKEGKGIYYYNNGDRYEGGFKNDKKEGKGIYYYNNGDLYEGDYKNDKKEGKGIYFNNGERYEGDYKNDIKEGKGIYYYNNGGIYEGDFKNDIREGKGIYYYNGERYEGDFKNDIREGKGIYYYTNGGKYEGDFKNDIREGKGIYYYSNDDMFEGDYKNDKKEGKGIYYYKNGGVYEGDYKNNLRHGQGIHYYSIGTIQYRNYNNGVSFN